MSKILEKRMLADQVWSFVVEAPMIAKRRQAGQFVIVRLWEGGERIPLTIADADTQAGTITLVVQAVGKSTKRMAAELNVGDSVLDLAGPLGKPTHIAKLGTVVVVGGGIGVAPVHPIAQALKAAGNRVIGILGARNRDLLIMEAEMRRCCDLVLIATDDGSAGQKGFVTDALCGLIEAGEEIKQVVAIGPAIMMKAVAELTRPYAIETVVSLNTIMIDGTGMCGGCRVLLKGENKFVCVDGPEFDGHAVDFDNLIARQRAYRAYEAESLQRWEAETAHDFAGPGCRLAQPVPAKN